MAERIIVNTGPLVALARMGALDAVGKLPYEFLCPLEVRLELEAGASLGHPVINPPWLTVCRLAGAVDPLALPSLDMGEAAVIDLAIELGISRVCIDESKGRRAAAALGLRVTGALGLLSRAKSLGIISSLRPFLERAGREGVGYRPDLVRRVLKAAGE